MKYLSIGRITVDEFRDFEEYLEKCFKEEVKMRHPVCIVPPHIYDEVRDNKTEFAKAFNGFMEGRL